jgi:hypothetical protein
MDGWEQGTLNPIKGMKRERERREREREREKETYVRGGNCENGVDGVWDIIGQSHCVA